MEWSSELPIPIQTGVVAWEIGRFYNIAIEGLDMELPMALLGMLSIDLPEEKHTDPRVRIWQRQSKVDSDALLRLHQTQQENLVAVLYQDPDPWIRAKSFSQIEDVERLQVALMDGSSLVRVAAAHQLANLTSKSIDACSALLQFVNHSDAYLRWKVAYGLRHCDATVVLMDLLQDIDIDVQRQAAQSLGVRPDRHLAKEALITASKSSNSFVRRWALQSLVTIEDSDVKEYLRVVYHNSPTLLERIIVRERLNVEEKSPKHYLPPKPSSLVEAQQMIQSNDATILKDIAKYFGKLKDPIAKDALWQLAQSSDSEIRKAAVEALGWQKDARLYHFLQDPDLDVLITALDWIAQGKMGNGAGIAKCLEISDTEVRLRTVEALSALVGVLSAADQEVLKAQIDDEDERIRAAVVKAHPELVDSKESSMWVRYVAVSAGADPTVFEKWTTSDVMTEWVQGDADQKRWLEGRIQEEDDFLHVLFSWNDPKDRPMTYQGLQPYRFRGYGQPNRG